MTSPPVLDELRLRRLIDAGRTLIAKLDVEAVLQQLLDVAREVTGARYAAVGVLDKSREDLERFVTAGIDPETHRAIGDLPQGPGHPRTADRRSPAAAARAHRRPSRSSYGFPSAHPEMETFLGVPVAVREEVWGNLYLTEKEGGGRLHRGRRGVRDHPRRLGRDRDRERAPLRRPWSSGGTTSSARSAVSTRRSRSRRRSAGRPNLNRILELIVKRARALVGARTLVIMLEQEDRARRRGRRGRASRGRPRPADGDRGDRDGPRPALPDAPSGSPTPALGADQLAGAAAPRRRRRADRAPRLPWPSRRRARPPMTGSARRPASIASTSGCSARSRRARRPRSRPASGRGAAAAPEHRGVRAGAPSLGARAARRDAPEPRRPARRPVGGDARQRGRPAHARWTTAVESITEEIANLRALIVELRPAALDEYGPPRRSRASPSGPPRARGSRSRRTSTWRSSAETRPNVTRRSSRARPTGSSRRR